VRVRFAPSPTGSLHIGGLRTALFNYLFARRHGGSFILRIEDTDQKRFDPTALQTLMEALRWAGLQWDEGPEVGGPYGPYVQSERLALYQHWANWLVENGKAYRAYETKEELDAIRKDLEARKLPPGYNRQHRDLADAQRAAFEAEDRKYVIRFKMPTEGTTIVQDALRGETAFDSSLQQDAVLLKADGYPTYHLAHVVDDYLMEISHVMRANEWFSSYPLHAQLWAAFGWEIPVYAHLPIMLNPNGKGKISKRNPPVDKHGNIIPVMVHDYMAAGYLPEAMVNFLTNIGWNFGDEREKFTQAEAIERFALDRINEADSSYPVEKLQWLNGEYIREMEPLELAKRLKPVLEKVGYEVNADYLFKVVPLVQPRIKTLNDIIPMAGFLFKEEFTPAAAEALIQKKMDAAQTATALLRSADVLATVEDFNTSALQGAIQPLTAELGLSNGQLFGVLRVAVTGQTVSTPTFETMEVLGKAETLARIHQAAENLRSSLEKPIPA
jgi:glutamyl-tRNA synthetase